MAIRSDARRGARLATPSDLPRALPLLRATALGDDFDSPARAAAAWSQMMARDGLAVCVSEEDCRLVAMATVMASPDAIGRGVMFGWLDGVSVDPAYRRRGHGRAVVRMALRIARSNGWSHVVTPNRDDDPALQRFYESCGFQMEGVQDNGSLRGSPCGSLAVFVARLSAAEPPSGADGIRRRRSVPRDPHPSGSSPAR